jgi:hypothetical protein
VTTPGWTDKFFGEPSPSGVCDGGIQVETPVGMSRVLCSEPITVGDRGSFMGSTDLT